MTPRERAITALELRQPDIVPHFELQMQLTEEYFGKDFVSRKQWEAQPERAAEFLEHNVRLLIRTADTFDYCIIFYCGFYTPDEATNLEGARMLRDLDGGRRLLLMHGDSTMGIPSGENMVDVAVAIFEEADRIKDEQSRAVDQRLEIARKFFDAGIDGFILCADYCFNDGPFLSPAKFSEFVTPYLTRLVAGYRQMGAYVIKHTDGDIMPILDQLVSANPHGLHSLDPMAGVDIAEVKRLYGDRIALIGNVNCALLQTGTREQILESCRYALESGKPGGGYIFSTSNVIFKGMPKETYDLMLAYYREHCAY
ncbi:hypothetical protein JXJ21_21510 [candidate division KSB1 bacterium]|nr:hypothetical protein [candidate division KSB1 bacterium]